MLRPVLFALVLATAACGFEDATPSNPAGGKGDDLGPSLLEFTGDFEERQSKALEAGDTAVVRYDLDRLPQCNSRDHGADVWVITGFMVVDGEQQSSFAVTRRDGDRVVAADAEIEIPDADSLELYFQVNDTFGCTEFDSNFGANYRFDIVPSPAGEPAVVSFDLDEAPEVLGSLRSGGDGVLHYDPERLAECATSQGDNVQWSVTARIQVDSGASAALRVGRAEGSRLVAADPLFDIEAGQRLSLRFEATSVFGCHVSDPADGSSYEFALAP